MLIYYGISNNLIDVTDICIEKLMENDIITIPSGDSDRAFYFTDHLFGVHKKIIIKNINDISEYDEYIQLKIDILNNKLIYFISEHDANNRLINIQSKLNIKYGSFNEELSEQKMVSRYLTGNEKVLELGGNIGRNSLIIASILTNSNNLVVLESDEDIANLLIENRNINNFNFQIENSALSKQKLIQKGWNTIPSDILIPEYKWVNTITLEELKNKYCIEFDTLILDCEGAFYYILMDMPEILNNINLIIMENDYTDISNKHYIDEKLIQNNFYRDYAEYGGWGPCSDYFWEVWKK